MGEKKTGFWMDDPVTAHAERKRREAAMTSCARGHVLTDAVLVIDSAGNRRCRLCAAISSAEATQARKERHYNDRYCG